MPFLALDGRQVFVAPGTSLLQACRDAGLPVPSLCHLEGVTEAACCRTCLVAVRGLGRPVPACATPAMDGMEVATDTHAASTPARQALSNTRVVPIIAILSRFGAVRVRTAHQHKQGRAPGPEEWLLYEWPADEPEPIKFWLSDLPADTPLKELVRLAMLRWRV